MGGGENFAKIMMSLNHELNNNPLARMSDRAPTTGLEGGRSAIGGQPKKKSLEKMKPSSLDEPQLIKASADLKRGNLVSQYHHNKPVKKTKFDDRDHFQQLLLEPFL